MLIIYVDCAIKWEGIKVTPCKDEITAEYYDYSSESSLIRAECHQSQAWNGAGIWAILNDWRWYVTRSSNAPESRRSVAPINICATEQNATQHNTSAWIGIGVPIIAGNCVKWVARLQWNERNAVQGRNEHSNGIILEIVCRHDKNELCSELNCGGCRYPSSASITIQVILRTRPTNSRKRWMWSP